MNWIELIHKSNLYTKQRLNVTSQSRKVCETGKHLEEEMSEEGSVLLRDRPFLQRDNEDKHRSFFFCQVEIIFTDKFLHCTTSQQ